MMVMVMVMSCRYHRLPLPVEGAPLEEHFDAFVNVLRVSSVYILGVQTLCNPSASIFNCCRSFRLSVGNAVSVCERGRSLSSPCPAVQLSGRCGSYQRGHDPGDSDDEQSDGKYTTITIYTHTVIHFSL